MSTPFDHDYSLQSLQKIHVKGNAFNLYVTPRFIPHYSLNDYEPVTALITRLRAKKAQAFIDVGAHYGFYSVLVGHANPDCRIFAFEPIPVNYEILLKNIGLNGIRDVHLIQAAVSDRNGNATFQVSVASDNSGFIANPAAGILQDITVNVTSLDHLIEEIPNKPTLIKIDTEGSERQVLQGMERLVEKVDELEMIIEFNQRCLKHNGVSPETLLQQIAHRGFSIFFIHDERGCCEKYETGTDWKGLMAGKNYKNLYCVKTGVMKRRGLDPGIPVLKPENGDGASACGSSSVDTLSAKDTRDKETRKVRKVLFVNHNLAPFELSGTPLSTLNHAMGMARKGIEAAVLIPSTAVSKGFTKEFSRGFSIYRVPALDKYRAYFAAPHEEALSGYLQAIGEIVDEFSPDVVHVNDYVYMPAEIIEIFSQRGCVVVRNVCNCEELCHQDYPVVSSGLKGRLCAGPGNPAKCSQCFLSQGKSLREEDAKASLETLTTRRFQYIRHLYSNAVDRVIFTTGAFKEYFTHFVPIPPEKIRVIPRGFQFDFPRPEKRRETADGTVHFAFIGNIMFSKGIDVVLNAFEKLGNRDDLVLHLYGATVDHEYEPSLQRLEQSHPGKFRYHGPFSKENLAEISRHIDVCIVPSYFDTYNRVLREMLHLGLPVIATDFFGSYIVEDGKNGFKIPVGDGQALTEKMTEILNDPALITTLSRAAAQTRIPSLEEEVDQLIKTYEELSPRFPQRKPAASQRKETSSQRQGNREERSTRLIAIYLPQYHPIAENDRWWGKGFTEWTNVAKAAPLFSGHYQPHVPADLGFCDLRLPEVRKAQAELARESGINGFCYYHYWFNGKLLLERPIQDVLKTGEPDFPFCLCWANENWTRRWDGGDHEILMEQKYSEQDDRNHIRYLAEFFRDPRYIRVGEKPLFLVYRANRIPDPSRTTRIWREEARRLGIGELYLCRVESFPDEHTDPAASGFDAAVEFQPDWTHVGPPVHHLAEKDCRIYRYGDVAQRMMKKATPPYKRFPCVTPRWDNSPRWKKGATIFIDSSPELYERWLRATLETFKPASPEENIVFLNAWNEWGEGNHLEPDVRFGRGYLEATKRALIATRRSKHEPAAEAHAGILSTLVAAGKRAEAVPALERLVESFPHYAPAYNDLGVLYYESGAGDKALASYEKAVSLDPESATFRRNLADYLYAAMKQPGNALPHYEKALSLKPRDTETLLILGNIRAESGDFRQAREYYLRVLEIDPSNDLAGTMFDALEARGEEPRERDAETLVREARCLARRGCSDRAVHLLETLLSTCPHHAAAHNDLGNLCCLLQKPDQALFHLERAAELAPEEIGFLRDLADAYLAERGDIERAFEFYNRALSLKPDDIDTLLRIGNVCAAQHQFDDARYFYNRVLSVQPEHPQAKENFAVLQSLAGGAAAPADSQSCPVCGSVGHRTVTKQNHPYYACAKCRAVFTPSIDPKILLTENQGSEGRHTPEMDGVRLSHLAYKAPFKMETVVDFGCGNGEYGRFLASRGIECLDIDQDTKLQLGDIPDESVDGINMVEVIEHLYDPSAYFKEFYRVLKPGGRLYVESSFVNGQDLQRWEYLSPAIGHCLVHSERSLALLARMFDLGLHRFNAHCYLFSKPLGARKPDGLTGRTAAPMREVGQQATVSDVHACPAAVESPAASASIIIPVFNQVDFTSRCLETLYANTPLDRVREVIVVDNASSDGTGTFLEEAGKRYPKLRVLTNRENLLFAKACNQAADIAGGDYLVFLNNDTEPLPGWLDRALERLERDDSIGVVGIKLLYPDTTVQHCGIQFQRNAHPSYVIWPLHRHLRAAADDPRVNAPGDVDAVTGACLFIRHTLFRRIGGFEERYGMYFEDTDLCFKARRAGKRVFYEPASVVIHHEGKSSPTLHVIHALNETSARRFFKTWKEDLYRIELDTLVEKEDGRYACLPDHFWPEEISPEAIVRMHALLSSFPPGYVHFGGAGDALLLLSTFYDKDPEQTVVSVSNSTGMMRSFFDAFPKLKKVTFIPFPKNYTWHFIARKFFKSSDICLGLGATPTTTADYREWNADLDIFTTYGIQRKPAWAVNFDKRKIEPVQLVIQPRGSLKGMVGSKRNFIHPKDWPRLLSYLAKKGIKPVVIGTPDEAQEYPCDGKAVDRRSYSFTEQLQLIAGSDYFVGADSWGKTFAALAGIRTFVFHAVRGDDLKGWKDASDYVFLDPWDDITVVKDFNDFRRAFDAGWRDGERSGSDLKIRWEGSQFVHHSLALVNRELCLRLIAGGCEISIIPYERDQFTPKEEPRFKPIAERTRTSLSGTADVHVRHQWPPDFTPPSEGHWVMIQPWEFGSLPKEWVLHMSTEVDELWVPSRYVRDCYIKSGVPAERVSVVPNGVDTDRFNPDNAPYPLKTGKTFKFLFVGGTIQRKGIDILLDAYTKTFSSGDDVCLVIKDMGGQSFYKGQTAKEWIRRFQDNPKNPEIEYIEHTLSDREIAGLYTACDCLVHPYRGEGFGLPIAEAMASGLPVIVTGHGAALDFCNDTIAYLIPAKEVRLPERRVGEFETVDFPWLAEPDREGLARLMRHASLHREEAASKGRLAAEFIRTNFTWGHAAEAAKNRIRELRGKPIVRLRRGDEPHEQAHPSRATAAKRQCGAAAGHESPGGETSLTLSPALAKADDLYQRGDLRGATEAYLAAIKATPWDRECYLSMAEMLVRTKHYKEAGDLLGEEILGAPDARLLSLLGSIQEGIGNDGEAGRLAAQALERTPRFAPALNLQGVLAFKRGDRDDARILFERAAEADPSWGEPLTNLGVLLWSAGEKEASLDRLENGFILSPCTADLAERYHAAASALGLHARAEKVFRDAGSRNPHNRTIAFLLIDLLISQESYEEAMTRIEAALSAFEVDDGFIDAALAVRNRIGPMTIDRRKARPSLSLCMIVKEEQSNLVRCLSSIKAAVDEMIVVDTGSTDRTKDLAAVFGANVFDVPWRDDFAEARNFSLSKASGDWVLVIDADETLSSGDHARIRDLIRKSPKGLGGYDLATRNYVIEANTAGWTANDGSYPDEESGTGWYANRKVRLFRRDPRIRFAGAVHELVETSIVEAKMKIAACDVPVHHRGKLNRARVTEKGMQYFELGMKKIEESGGTPRAIFELAIQAGELGRYDDAVDLWRRFLNGDPGQEVRRAYVNLINACLNADRFDEALVEARKAEALANGTRELLLNCAAAEFFAGDLRKAATRAQKLLQKNPDYPPALGLLAMSHALTGREESSLEVLHRLQGAGLETRSQLLPAIEKLRIAGKEEQADRLQDLLDRHFPGAAGYPGPRRSGGCTTTDLSRCDEPG